MRQVQIRGLGHFGDAVSAMERFGDGTFRRWWSQMFYTKKVFLKCSRIAL